MKKVRNMNVKLTYYARETHCASNSLIEWWTFILLVGFANAMRRLPIISANEVDDWRSNRNATFQRHNRSWLDVGRCQACKSYGARSVIVDRNENSRQESITRARYDACLTRVDVSRGVGVPCEMVRLGCRCHAPARDGRESDNK